MQVQPYLFFDGRPRPLHGWPGAEGKVMHASFRVGRRHVLSGSTRRFGAEVLR